MTQSFQTYEENCQTLKVATEQAQAQFTERHGWPASEEFEYKLLLALIRRTSPKQLDICIREVTESMRQARMAAQTTGDGR